jgi:Putative porin
MVPECARILNPTTMKKTSSRNNSTKTKATLYASTAALLTLAAHSQAQTINSDPLIDKLEQKGILSASEVAELRSESVADQTNLVNGIPASKWKIADSIKSIQLFGDLRLRYEYRVADNVPGANPGTYYRERFRYALRIGIRGDLVDDFNYGLRLETGTNPRSPWDTFGNSSSSAVTSGTATPSDKFGSGLGIGQAFIGWHPTSWYEMTVGRMPMPLYTTPMVWDSDINPDGAFEKFKLSVGNVDLFADFAQFDYQDPSEAFAVPSSDAFILAWQAGATVNLPKSMSFKIAPMFYTYTGIRNTGNGLNQPFVGQGNSAGANPGVPGSGTTYLNPGPTDYNEDGLDNLLILEVPAEFDFKIHNTPLGTLQGRVFGDFAYNLKGDDRATAAYDANPGAFPGVGGPVYGQNKAYQVGIGIGSDGPLYGPTQGLVYGTTAKKNAWEARFYWQHIEQYALDVNLIDSDFFEGRANLQGVYSAFAYSFTDAIIGTVRYGYASKINSSLDTGGSNLDIPGLNPINNYQLVQMDLTWRF